MCTNQNQLIKTIIRNIRNKQINETSYLGFQAIQIKSKFSNSNTKIGAPLGGMDADRNEGEKWPGIALGQETLPESGPLLSARLFVESRTWQSPALGNELVYRV
jgi:hypothetical protein